MHPLLASGLLLGRGSVDVGSTWAILDGCSVRSNDEDTRTAAASARTFRLGPALDFRRRRWRRGWLRRLRCRRGGQAQRRLGRQPRAQPSQGRDGILARLLRQPDQRSVVELSLEHGLVVGRHEKGRDDVDEAGVESK